MTAVQAPTTLLRDPSLPCHTTTPEHAHAPTHIADIDGHDGYDGAADVGQPQPCGYPDCDHGWITITSHGIGTVIPCPPCPTGLRDHHHDDAGYPDNEPPF